MQGVNLKYTDANTNGQSSIEPKQDGASTSTPEDIGSKIEKMLNQIPPDWDLAERHGTSNLAYDPSKCTEPYDQNSEIFCHCCQR